MLTFTNEEKGKTHSKTLCPRFARCKARYCPLDETLQPVRPFRPEHFCYYYLEGGKFDFLDAIPGFLTRPLLEYSVLLLELGITNSELAKKPD